MVYDFIRLERTSELSNGYDKTYIKGTNLNPSHN
jgi:hypothetical protein